MRRKNIMKCSTSLILGLWREAVPSTLTFIFIQVNNKPFGWAMGYIINQAAGYSDTPYQSTHPYSAVDLVIGMIVLTILCAIFVIFFFLTFYACKKVLMNSNGYQSLS